LKVETDVETKKSSPVFQLPSSNLFKKNKTQK
jgi:hypothetical protein